MAEASVNQGQCDPTSLFHLMHDALMEALCTNDDSDESLTHIDSNVLRLALVGLTAVMLCEADETIDAFISDLRWFYPDLTRAP
jgi:hypothetical protein